MPKPKTSKVKPVKAIYKQIICGCKREKHNQKIRGKYGVAHCDTYSFDYTFGIILSNGLLMYVEIGSQAIMRDDWEVIKKHAEAIRAYSRADNFDIGAEEVSKRFEYLEKERAWREAMHWLTENWRSLWW